MQAAVTPGNGPGASSAVTYTTVEIEKVASWVRRTSPAMMICLTGCLETAPELADVDTKIINMSIGLGVVPASWRTVIIITPVPKCKPVTRLDDLIFITLILSTVVERLVIKDHIFPAIPLDQLHDQFGFKPTGGLQQL